MADKEFPSLKDEESNRDTERDQMIRDQVARLTGPDSGYRSSMGWDDPLSP